MALSFNIAGPCFPDEHYMIPPERRVGEAMKLIEGGRWFTLVSGRQTGKTTHAQWMAHRLNAMGRCAALWVDLETARELPEVSAAMHEILTCFERSASFASSPVGALGEVAVEMCMRSPNSALERYLRAMAAQATKSLVLLLDEADTLVGPAMVSFLTQLRALYLSRKESSAPSSVALVGVRAVRDYLMPEERRGLRWLGTASPFNVTVENVGISPFTEDEVGELLDQHTHATGQRFDPLVAARVYALTSGHPWLVNALADQATRRDAQDRAVAVTVEHIERAKETVILERRTHIDSLLARLREDRVRRVIGAMIEGGRVEGDTVDDDLAYTAGLGLIRKIDGSWQAANAIYREVVLRTITASMQDQLPQKTAWYLRADGALDMPKLMRAWQEFWREDGHLAADGFGYREAGAHLMLMAFLQRVVNGGGTIEREYALGRGALDMLIEWKTTRVAIEMKLRRHLSTEKKGVVQLAGYLEALGLSEGWLVVFDLRAKRPWSRRLFTKTVKHDGRKIHVVGC